SMPCCPPRSPLFPYTTLFRSGAGQRVAHAAQAIEGIVGVAGGLGEASGLANHVAVPVVAGVQRDAIRPREVGGLVVQVVGVDGRDRKSTRLNSSHSQISYAVF